MPHDVSTSAHADIAPDLAVLVERIDGPERVERHVPRICELVQSGTITLEDVAVVKYTIAIHGHLLPDRVSGVMTREVVSVHPRAPVEDVVRMLLDRDFRAVPVVDDKQRVV